MRHSFVAFGLVGLAVGACAQETRATPAQQYEALLSEFRAASSASRPASEADRLQLIARGFRLRDRLANRLVELADRYPAAPIAIDALSQAVWQVNSTPWPAGMVGHDDAWTRAFDLLLRDHAGSERLGPVCLRVSIGFREEYERFLRGVLAKSPRSEVTGQVCLALGHYLANRQQRLGLLAGSPRLADEFAELFGKQYLEELQRRDPAEVERECEALFERALREYGEVRLSEGDTVGACASKELFGLRNLCVGKQAIELEGEDQHGVRLSLREHLGKVVLLDFWSTA